jgi:hypothetical protein
MHRFRGGFAMAMDILACVSVAGCIFMAWFFFHLCKEQRPASKTPPKRGSWLGFLAKKLIP